MTSREHTAPAEAIGYYHFTESSRSGRGDADEQPAQQYAPLKIATYNIHGGVGSDGRFVPNRIAAAIDAIDADIIALQEVESRATGFDMLEFLAAETELRPIAGPTLLTANGDYGNGILTRLRVRDSRLLDLSWPGREPRGAIDAELMVDSRTQLRVIATHLGLRPAERRQQVRRLLAAFEHDRALPTVFMGDVNEWFLVGRPLRWLHRHFQQTPSPASFPARMPLFALDRIWVKPRTLLQKIQCLDTPLMRAASDHLPVIADIAVPCVPRSALQPAAQRGPAG